MSEQKWTGIPDFEGGLKTVFREDVGPLRLLGSWRAGNDPEASRLLDDGHLLGIAGCDRPAPTQEADLAGFLDDPGVVGREMQIEEFGWRCRTPAGASFRDAFLDGLEGRKSGSSGDVVCVVPVDLGRKKLVCLRPVADRLHGEKGGKALLPEAELALDLAFGLGIPCNDVADAEAAEGALELGKGVGVAGFARLVAEEAQAVGVEVVGKAVGEEDFPDMGEVGEGGFGLDEASPDDETGGVVDGQGKDLEFLAGPPLVRRAVVLEEIPIALALPSAAGFGAAFERFVQQRGHVLEDMAADVGDGAFEGEAAEEFVGQEAEVGGLGRGEGRAQECFGFIRPRSGVIASGWREREAAASGQPEGPQGVEA